MITAEREARKREHVFGSEIAAVCGFDPYRSIHDVYDDKVGLKKKEEKKEEQMVLGTYCGPALVMAYQEIHGRKCIEFGADERTHFNGICAATPDAIDVTDAEHAVVETKFPSRHTSHMWGDNVPHYVMAQITWQMGATKLKKSVVASYLGVGLSVYKYEFDEELYSMLHDKAAWFLRQVEKGLRPPVDGSDSCSKSLMRRFPSTKGEVVQADDDAACLMISYRNAWLEAESYKKKLSTIEQTIKEKIGTGYAIECPGVGRIVWSSCAGKKTTNWEKISRSIAEKHGINLDEEVINNTKIGKPYRTFRPELEGMKKK